MIVHPTLVFAKCGAALQQACAQCGFQVLPDFAFCPKCGTPLAPAAFAPAPDVTADRLQRLMPREFAEQLLATRDQVGKERRMVAILFSDVKGSTAMAENLDPEEWVEIMEGAFDVLIEPITRYEGTVARLMGDAIRSMTKKLLPEFVSLLSLYEQWAADPVLSTKDRRSVESAVKTLRRVA
jgi:adenylate cyclase